MLVVFHATRQISRCAHSVLKDLLLMVVNAIFARLRLNIVVSALTLVANTTVRFVHYFSV
jgi:hypothetical protein